MKKELKQSTRYSGCFFSLACALVVVLFTFPEPLEARAGLVYAQPLATTNIGGYLSTSALGAKFISADNFNLTATASIGEVTWIGSSLLRNGDVGKPADYINPALDYSGWEIRFYSSTGGVGSTTSQPSTLLYDQVVGFSAANQTAVSGTTNYTYDAVLPTSFVASAGTQYWFSVQALVSNPDSMTNGLFLWGFGNAGNSNEVTDDLSTSTLWDYHNQTNLGFTLSTIPEPSSLTLCGIAIAIGLVITRIRRPKLAHESFCIGRN